MRSTKFFGSVVMAAAILAVLLGASSAMAVTELEEVVLCTTSSGCPEGKDLPAGTTFDEELVAQTKWVILGGALGSLECTQAEAQGQTTALLAHGQVQALLVSGCTYGGEECTEVVAEHLNYLVRFVLSATHASYELILGETENGVPQIRVVCPLLKCTFSSHEVPFQVEFGTSDVVISVLRTISASGLFCPSSPVWHAKFLLRCLKGSSLIGCWPNMEI